MALTELEYTYELKRNLLGKKQTDYVKVPVRTTFDKSFVIKTVCTMAPPNACERVAVVLQGGDRIIIDKGQYDSIF